MKKWYITIALFFMVPILFLFGISMVDKNKEKSETENRNLAQFPKFTFARLFNGEFTQDFQTYFADQFPSRDNYLDLSKYINSMFNLQIGDAVIDVDVDNKWEHGGSVDPDNDDDVLQTTAATQGTDSAPATQPTSAVTSGTTTEGNPGVFTRATTPGSTAESTSGVTEPTEQTTAATEFQWSTAWTELASPWGEEQDPGGDVSSLDSGILFVGNRAMERVYKVDSYLEDYAQTVNNLYHAIPDSVHLFAILVPKSIEFNAPASYRAGQASQLAAINYAYSLMDTGIVCVDAYSNLFEHRTEDLYFRTDHHWTARGAYYAFQALCSYGNLQCKALDSYTRDVVPGFLGTMYTYTQNYAQSEVLKNNPDDVEIFRSAQVATMTVYSDFSLSDGAEKNLIYSTGYANESLPASWKYYVFLGGDRPICHIENPSVTNGRKVLILKESYGNAFTPFLADAFSEVWAVDPREFNGEGEPSFSGLAGFIAEKGITDVIVLNNVQSAIPSYMSNINDLLGIG